MAKTTAKTNPSSTDLKATFWDLTTKLEEFFTQKAPSLPANVKEIIVKYAPIITIIVLIVALPPILFVLGLGTILTPFAYLGGVSAGFGWTFDLIFLVASIVLQGLSIPGLMARTKAGWNLSYYAAWLSSLHSLFAANLISAVISFALSMWLLFQIRDHYTK